MSNAPSPTAAGTPVPSVALRFAEDVPSPDVEDGFETATVSRKMPFDGVVQQIYVDIPSGVRSLAGFKIKDAERGVKQFPFDDESEYASYDDVSQFWPVSFPLREGDQVEVDYINYNDNVDSHFLKVWLIFVGIEALPYTMEELADRNGVEL